MKAEIIAVGNELLSGCTTDTNSVFLSKELLALGIEIIKKVIVEDNREEILDALKEAIEKAEIVIITGGLGPTHDDITKKTVSSYFNRRLVLNDKLFRKIERFFIDRATKMPTVNTTQALVPHGATILDNPIGTAPGILLTEQNVDIIMLPGVPIEMEAIFSGTLKEMLGSRSKEKVFLSKNLHTTGISESALYEKVRNLKWKRNIAFLPFPKGVDIEIAVEADSVESGRETLSMIEDAIVEKVDYYYYGSDGETLERVIGILLTMRKKKLSVAESCTAGLLMKRITDVPGSSFYFHGGVVSYSNEAKVQILKVRKGDIKKRGEVSQEVARQMASGVKDLFESDIGISITGIAGPSGGTENKPVGLVYIALADGEDNFAKEYHFSGTREIIREKSAQAALDLLRKKMLGMENINE